MGSSVCPVDFVETVVKAVIITVHLSSVAGVFSNHTLLVEFAIFVQEMLVLVHVGTCGYLKEGLLVLDILLGCDVVLDEQIAELRLEQVKPFDLLSKIFSQSLVGKD